MAADLMFCDADDSLSKKKQNSHDKNNQCYLYILFDLIMEQIKYIFTRLCFPPIYVVTAEHRNTL